MGNLSLYESFRSVPEEAQKPIKGGRISGFTDINPMWRIKKLTETFGPCGIGWYYIIEKQWLETSGDEIAAFCNISLYVWNGEKWSMPIQGTGGSGFAVREKAGVRVSDECYKMALTDAISVACKALGVGADIYWSNDRTKYSKPDTFEPATEAQIKAIRELCEKHNINRTALLAKKGVEEKNMTAAQAGAILSYIKIELKKHERKGENPGNIQGLENREEQGKPTD